eukprot:5712824-Amphidinium_carterae.1
MLAVGTTLGADAGRLPGILSGFGFDVRLDLPAIPGNATSPKKPSPDLLLLKASCFGASDSCENPSRLFNEFTDASLSGSGMCRLDFCGSVSS